MNDIICGDALTILRTLPDGCARCCVTSPPYFNLRDYGVPGQIGLEPTMGEYITRLVEVFIEVKRVLTSDGTLWLNLADSYAGKSLMGIPWRVAFALQDSGWILRQDIIWSKSNCMPESVRDRCTKSHEYIFLFAKNQRYYFNNSAILEPATGFNNALIAGSDGAFGQAQSRKRKENGLDAQNTTENDTRVRRIRSVWDMATATGGNIKHYAKFPDKLAERCILCGTAEGDIVLDPFAGSGTTCRIANRYGRRYIGIDLNPAYCKAAEAEIPINLF